MTDVAALMRDNPILAKFRAALNEMYGERLERVLLYGSQARGDAHADSDYDVAVFLKDLSDRWAEADKIAVTTTDILRETGTVIHAMPYPAGAYRDNTPLMHEIRREGLDL
jgi:predicted nucleotidyltransferase